jgi:hypothetical protein
MSAFVWNGVRLEAPGHWIDASVITLICPEGPDGFRPNVLVSREPLDGVVSAEAYAKSQSVGLRKQYKAYKVHREERVQAGEREAYLVEHSFKSPENLAVRQQQVYVVKDGMVFTMALTHLEDHFEQMRESFDRVRASFQVD